ncbi:thaumatin-like protein [Henckelia pumila]|uniref:thaumatin-like protein n=1 Tax=Henckelia pumila TaxID=405737 RepID=UPI003C6E3A7D
MSSFKHTPLFISFLIITLFFDYTNATTFYVRNNCPFTVWAAAVPGGNRELRYGERWVLDVERTRGQIWARTGCTFNETGQGKCQTGDCNGQLECQDFGTAPFTAARYALDRFNNLDFFDVSLIEGYNVGMDFRPITGYCRHSARCKADIIKEYCPKELQAPGGCRDACSTLKEKDYYCCTPAYCEPTVYSKFFKEKCPQAYSYVKDDETSMFSCSAGTKYRVIFCP